MLYVIELVTNSMETSSAMVWRKKAAEDFGSICMIDPESSAKRFILSSYDGAKQLAEILIQRQEVKNVTLKYCK